MTLGDRVIRGWLLSLALGGAGSVAAADAPKTIIHAGHLIATPGKPSLERQSIVIENGKIVAVVDGYIDGGRIIDLTQAWVMPGLIDMHTHVTVTMDINSDNPTSDFMPAFLGRPSVRALASAGRARTVLAQWLHHHPQSRGPGQRHL